MLKQIQTAGVPISFRKVICPGKDNICLVSCKIQSLFSLKLGLIRKYCGYNTSELITYGIFVAFICYINKFIHGSFVQSVNICLVVKPGVGFVSHAISVPFVARCLFGGFDSFIVSKLAVFIQQYVIAPDKIGAS